MPDNEVPAWFKVYQEENSRRFLAGDNQFEEIKNTLQEMQNTDKQWRENMSDTMQPIIEIFDTVGRIGRWGKVALTTFAVVLTIVLTLKNILK